MNMILTHHCTSYQCHPCDPWSNSSLRPCALAWSFNATSPATETRRGAGRHSRSIHYVKVILTEFHQARNPTLYLASVMNFTSLNS